MSDEKMISQKPSNAHKNHRNRLKNKVRKYGLDCLENHEVLELLLTYTIPRKDTNPLGHELLDCFGSFANVLDADYHDLLKIKGVGEESALFINVLSQCMERYSQSKIKDKILILNNTSACVQFFRDNYRIKNNEFMVVACLGKNKRVVKTYKYQGKDETEISFNIRKIINDVVGTNVNSIVLYHTHPLGLPDPTLQDIDATQSIINICLANNIDFDDHIILNENTHFSFKHNDLINKMKIKYATLFNANDIYKELNFKKK